MTINEVNAKTILRKQKRLDSWFVSGYGMNLYRGCSHGCAYCDGRDKKYQVNHHFSEHIEVKVNALELLNRELDPSRKRKPMRRSFMMIGGGVCDAYQPIEKKYRITRGALELMEYYGHPVHVLTKSVLVERDLDVLQRINRSQRAIVSMSFSSTDPEISAVFEPGVPSPAERLACLTRLKQAGLACGMFLMPVVPFLTDTPRVMDKTLRDAKDAGIDFVVFGGMTLKDGRQRDYFMGTLRYYYPDLAHHYEIIYRGDKWGGAVPEYYAQIEALFAQLAARYRLPKRVPAKLFYGILSDNDQVAVILEQLDYLLRIRGATSTYRYAARSIFKLETDISDSRRQLRTIAGVGQTTERFIREIIERGTCGYYEKMLRE